MKKAIILALILLSGTAPAKDIDFELLNKSGHDFSRLWLAKHETKSWSRNLLREALKDNASVRITLANKNDWQLWDLRLEYTRRNWELFTDGFELPKIERITISIQGGNWKAHFENRAAVRWERLDGLIGKRDAFEFHPLHRIDVKVCPYRDAYLETIGAVLSDCLNHAFHRADFSFAAFVRVDVRSQGRHL